MVNLGDPTAMLKRPMRGRRLEKNGETEKGRARKKKDCLFIYFSAPLYFKAKIYSFLPCSALFKPRGRKKINLIISIGNGKVFF